jgi:hypothetical protein
MAQSCGKLIVHDGMHVPVMPVAYDITVRQQTPASPQEAAELQGPPERPESIAV